MSYNLSVCVFIKDTFKGAFCLFESMYQLMPFASEFIVMDLGSTDGTYEVLLDIASGNEKVKLVQGQWPEIDAGAFATLANDLIAMCKYDNVLYYQSDEIWHEDLVKLMKVQFDKGNFDLSFWRVQLRENFQIPERLGELEPVKWFPHVVHRVGHKDKFNFVGDGMNSDRFMEPPICSNYGGENFLTWADDYRPKPTQLPLNEMILDVSLVGAFLENIAQRRGLHAPFWHEEPTIEGEAASAWMRREKQNQNWYKTHSPFDIPKIMKWHLGRIKYILRPELRRALKFNERMEDDIEWR